MTHFPLHRTLVAGLLAVAVAAPAAAQTLRVERSVNVTGTANGFEVQNGGGLGARGVWCGAATYAQKVLGASETTRLYVGQTQARGPVTFTLDPAGLTPSAVSSLGASIRQPGANLSVAHASTFCNDFSLISGR